jgi:hypothetical protein
MNPPGLSEGHANLLPLAGWATLHLPPRGGPRMPHRPFAAQRLVVTQQPTVQVP